MNCAIHGKQRVNAQCIRPAIKWNGDVLQLVDMVRLLASSTKVALKLGKQLMTGVVFGTGRPIITHLVNALSKL